MIFFSSYMLKDNKISGQEMMDEKSKEKRRNK